MGFLTWIIFGLIAGVIAKWISPGKDGGGFIMTIILGIVGAFVGGFIGKLIGLGPVDSFSIGNLILAIIGAIIVLWAYHKLTK